MILNSTNQYLLKIQVTMIPNFTNKEELSGSMLIRGKSVEERQQQLLGGMDKRPWMITRMIYVMPYMAWLEKKMNQLWQRFGVP